MTNHEFYVPWAKDKVKYNVGQPMGAYSSWAVFTLSHHILVWIAGMMCGKPHFDQYVILGDDIVIADTAVYNHYKQLIKDLGVSLS